MLVFVRPIAVWSKYSNAQRVSSLHVYHHHERNHPGGASAIKCCYAAFEC